MFKNYHNSGCVQKGYQTVGVVVAGYAKINEAETCAEKCNRNPECDVWTLTLSTQMCILKKKGAVILEDMPVDDQISGRKCGKYLILVFC